MCYIIYTPWLVRLIPTTFSNGCLGSHNDDERSEMRYVMRIAKLRESLKFWTHIAPSGNAWGHTYLSVYIPHSSHMIVYGDGLWLWWRQAICCYLNLNVYGVSYTFWCLKSLPALVKCTTCMLILEIVDRDERYMREVNECYHKFYLT